MPIVSISKIQHRYGLSENLPQLSAAELGWVIDERKLYIGNGPTGEGAPEIGNTEILTEFSDVLGLSQTYTYKGEAAGYIAQTGSTSNNAVTRSLQAKFDDMASVKDFGATGDGVTDDTDAINRALYQIFCRDNNSQTRRSLFFPAGTYLISGEIKIPTYAMIKGEGTQSTIIRQTSSSANSVARTADSAQQVGANVGNNGADLPNFIDVYDITFQQTTANSVFIMNATTNSRFVRVDFQGQVSNPNSAGDSTACLEIYSTAANHSSQLVFEQCRFTNNSYGIIIDDDVNGVLFNSCRFDTLYKGIKLGEGTTGSGASVDGPRSINITNSYFDTIYSNGIHTYLISDIVSAFNFYTDVGNHFTGLPVDNIIIFGSDGCTSICDTFSRTIDEDKTVARINLSNSVSLYIQQLQGFVAGKRQIRPAFTDTLSDNTAVATNAGPAYDAATEGAIKLHYSAKRGTALRHGVLTITRSINGIGYSDDFVDDTTDIGLTLSAIVDGAFIRVRYVTSSTGDDVDFTYGAELIAY